MTYNFKGKTAVVTGASRGIGEAIARTLANDGAKVALVARSVDRLKSLAASLPNGAIAIEADMSSADGWKAAAEKALAALGDIDILVNNAGVSTAEPMGKVTGRASTRRSTSTSVISSCSPMRSAPRSSSARATS